MSELKADKPEYGNWVAMRLLYGSGAAAGLLVALSLISPILIVVALLFGVTFAYFAYARWQFSPRGGNIQARIHALVLGRLNWDGIGKALDIGCGNAALTIRVARNFPQARVTGLDYWGGGMWEYSNGVCERNARIEGVANRVNFQKASASALPFDDGSFDAVVSNFVFHEVSDSKDKRQVIKEALRVVKKGGRFAFQDLFRMKRVFGEVDDLVEAIRSWGIENVDFEDTSHSDFVPNPLRLPFMLGTMGILYGKK